MSNRQLTKSESATAALQINRKDIVSSVENRVGELVEHGDLHLPKNYSVPNALRSAWLTLQDVVDKDKKPALEVCTPNSIANSLLDMIVQGLNTGRRQGYFIVYGKSLVFQRSYLGSIALVRRIYGQDTDVRAEVVYEDDDFEYELRPRKRVTKHIQSLKNVSNDKVIGAYVEITFPGDSDREPVTEIMTIDEIKKAWQQGQTKGNSPAHQKFTGEMSKKTVINRGCKILISSADDSSLAQLVKRQETLNAETEVEAEITEEANTGPLLDVGSEDPIQDDAIEDAELAEEAESTEGELTPEQEEELARAVSAEESVKPRGQETLLEQPDF